MREAGCTATQEVAFTLANAIAYIQTCLDKGLKIDDFALRFRELRRLAEGRLGPSFDIRAYHDVVLGAGSVPLDVVERRVRRWIRSQPAGAMYD